MIRYVNGADPQVDAVVEISRPAGAGSPLRNDRERGESDALAGTGRVRAAQNARHDREAILLLAGCSPAAVQADDVRVVDEPVAAADVSGEVEVQVDVEERTAEFPGCIPALEERERAGGWVHQDRLELAGSGLLALVAAVRGERRA